MFPSLYDIMAAKQGNESVLLCRGWQTIPESSLPWVSLFGMVPWGGFRTAALPWSFTTHISSNRKNGMNIPSIYLVVYSGIMITFGEAGLSSVDHLILPPSQPFDQFSSVSVMSNSTWLHGPQHTRSPCPSPTFGVYSNSYPLSWWCHPTISSSVIPFSSCLQSYPATGSFIFHCLKIWTLKDLPEISQYIGL